MKSAGGLGYDATMNGRFWMLLFALLFVAGCPLKRTQRLSDDAIRAYLRRDFRQAQRVLEVLYLEDATLPGVANNLGVVRYALRQLKDAERALKRAAKLQPNAWEIVHNRVLVAIGDRRWEQARRLLRQLRQQRPKDEQLRYLSWAVNFRLGEETNVGELKRVCATAKAGDPLRLEIARAALKTAPSGDPSRSVALQRLAQACLRDFLRAHRDHGLAQLLSGVSLLRQGKNAAAVSALKHAMRLAPAEPRLPYLLGTAYLLKGDLQLARQTLTLGVGHTPKHPALYHNLGVVQFRLGRYADARDAFRQALTGQNQALATLFGLALTQFKLREYREAMRTSMRFKQLARGDTRLDSVLAALRKLVPGR